MTNYRLTTPRLCEHCGQAFFPWRNQPGHRHCSTTCGMRAAGAKRKRPPEERFWALISKTEGGCWLWVGGKTRGGYGLFEKAAGVKRVPAHRYAWELLRGPIPEGLWVLHDCPGGDNPACVNPDHLFVGTQADNEADKVRKGRTAKGERQGSAKLTVDKVREMRHGRAEGESLNSLARRFRTSKKQVLNVVQRKHWRHVE